jgi:rubrerythrin
VTPESILNRLRQIDDATLIALANDTADHGSGWLRIDNNGKLQHVPAPLIRVEMCKVCTEYLSGAHIKPWTCPACDATYGMD